MLIPASGNIPGLDNRPATTDGSTGDTRSSKNRGSGALDCVSQTDGARSGDHAVKAAAPTTGSPPVETGSSDGRGFGNVAALDITRRTGAMSNTAALTAAGPTDKAGSGDSRRFCALGAACQPGTARNVDQAADNAAALNAPGVALQDELAFLECRAAAEPFPLTDEQVDWLRQLGDCLLAFYRAKNKLYRRSVEGQIPSWIAQYLDNGKPDALVQIGRAKAFRDDLPAIIRPDILLLQSGYAICELDSVPGGFGLAARIADCYRRHGYEIAGDIPIEQAFVGAVASGPSKKVAIVVSDESQDYYPEMDWLSRRLREFGSEVYATHPRHLSYTEEAVFIDSGSQKIQIDTVYRFAELFDLKNVSKSELLLYLAKAKRIRLTPPAKAYLEEKLWFALFHHPVLQRYWRDELGERDMQTLHGVLPPSWILDPTPLPGQAVIPGLVIDHCPAQSWEAIRNASKRNREMVIKPSGFSELAWGSRGVVIGHDVSAEAWADAVDVALSTFPKLTWILQPFRSAARHSVRAYRDASGSDELFEGRVRLNPFYFIENGKAVLSTILATICSSEKKKIHGMPTAVMTVCCTSQGSGV